LVVALLALAVVGAIYQAIATERAERPYPPPGEMGPEPRDAKQISSELRAQLTKDGIEGPYVLVGHSFGGLYMQTYATRYPTRWRAWS
jgi:pimeloyl-ACP methyl ester carboxylesterase